MKIYRRDVLIVSFLINAALFSFLFFSSNVTDRQDALKKTATQTQSNTEAIAKTETPAPAASLSQRSIVSQAHPEYRTIIVKEGDFLAKIARKHQTSVDKIIKMNQLQSHRLKPGQELKLPLEAPSPVASTQNTAPSSAQSAPLQQEEYYTVQSGDNPWLIAKKHKVSLKNLLQINNLNDESAKNLKVGDKIRIR